MHLDGIAKAEERALLARFRKALHIGEEDERALAPLRSLEDLPPDERPEDIHGSGVHVLEMLLRVALSDWHLSSDESQWLRGEAAAWGVAPLELASLRVRIEEEVRRERAAKRHEEELGRRRRAHLRLQRMGLAIIAGVGAALSGIIWWRTSGTHADSVAAKSSKLQELEQRCESALVFLAVQYDLVDDSGHRLALQASGTGFFVTDDGWIATNKHVVQPWKFSADVCRFFDEGYRLDESSLVYGLWLEGAPVESRGTRLALDSMPGGGRRVRVLATPPDVFEERSGFLARGGTYTGRMHVFDDSDLALLAADFDAPVPVLELALEDESIAKLDEVLVLGFPAGELVFEHGKAECSATVGAVRKVEDSIYISAPLIGGNSGGPLIDAHGHVLGVATRTLGDASMGCCIRTQHLRALMSGVR